MKAFSHAVLGWHERFGIKQLPWFGDSYLTWVAEVMLQQTQLASALPYFERFASRFPHVKALAQAQEEEVLALWSGLGYYSRGRNLWQAARRLVQEGAAFLPREKERLLALPGIGPNTASAIIVYAFGGKEAVMDANVKRILARVFAVTETLGSSAAEKTLASLASSLLPEEGLVSYTQGLLDLGRTVCRPRNPDCASCPLQNLCRAYRLGRPQDFPRQAPKRQKKTIVLRGEFPGNSQGVALCRRKEGFWKGLWTFVEKKESAVCGKAVFLLPEVSHALTHLILDIRTCAVLEDAPLEDGLLRENIAWFSWKEVFSLPLPSPITRLLRQAQAHLV